MKKRLLNTFIIATITIGLVSPVHAKTSSSLVPYSDGLDDRSTSSTKYVELNEQLSGHMLVTKDGLSIIGNDQFKVTTSYPVEEYEIVKDVDQKGQNDILVYMSSPNGQDNLALISSEDSSVLFSKNYSHLSNQEGKGAFQENSIILQLLYNNERIYVLYDYHIACLDTQGNEIFDYENEDNIWKMLLIEGKGLAITTQTGEVKLLDDQIGKVIWEKQLVGKRIVPTLELNVNAEVQLNTWDMYYENNILYVTSEDGSLTELNIETGEVTHQVDLEMMSEDAFIRQLGLNEGYDFVNYRSTVFPSGLMTSGFMSCKIEESTDQTLLISNYLGSEKRRLSLDQHNMPTEGQEVIPSLAVYDKTSKEVTHRFNYERYNLAYSNAIYSTYQDKEVIIAPSFSKQGELKVNIYSLEDDSLIAQESIKVPNIKESNEKIKITKVDDRYLIQSDNKVSFFVSQDFKAIEYVGNLSMAFMIADSDTGMFVGYQESGMTTKIKKLNNGHKDDVLFSFDLPEMFLENSNGFENIYYDENTNHLLMLVNTKDASYNTVSSYILIVDGNTGEVLANDRAVLDKGIDEHGKAYTHYVTGESIRYLKDMNQDGTQEVLVDSFVIDTKTMTLKSMYFPSIEETGLTIEVGDVNGDEISDLVVFNETQANLYYSKVSGFNISYAKSGIKLDYAKELQNHIHAVKMEDLDHDGIHDVIINERNNNGCQVYRVIDSKTLQPKYDLMSEGVYGWGESFEFPQQDFNQDGVDDIIFNSPSNSTDIISGQTGGILDSYKKYAGEHNLGAPLAQETIVPIKIESNGYKVTLIDDVNGDGKKDVAYLYALDEGANYIYGTGLMIKDSTTFEEITSSTVIPNDIMEDKRIINIQGSSKVMFKDGNKMQVYDVANSEPIASFDIEVKYAKNISDTEFVIVNNEGNLYLLNDKIDFNVNNQTLKGGQMTLSWDSDKNGIMSISQNGEKIISTANQNVSFKLLEGEHDLVLSYDDGYGKTTHQTIHVNVKKGNLLRYVLNSSLVLVVGLIVGLLFYPQYRLNKKAGVKRGKTN